MDERHLQRWHDSLCSSCKKRKANFPKARCQIWYSLFVAKSPTAIQNADVLVNERGICKSYERNGDGDR